MLETRRQILLVLLVALALGLTAFPAVAQPKRPIVRPGGGVVPGTDGAAPAQPGVPGQPNPAANPADPNKPADPNAPKEGAAKKDGPSPLTSRPAKPQTPPNPDELKNLKLDADGKVKFNLKGQPWPDVLDWLAETSQKSLDWQELPNDYLNLVTQQSYSIVEARDLLNRHLLSRGFTMLTHGEQISVVNVTKINPGMVPRIEPDELATLPDYDFVKTSFPLAWLLADQAENELKPMLSPNGKLTHLTNTNRLEAMDSVKNLREIWTVIQEEQSGGKQEQLVREFKLKHTKAAEVLDQLHTLLGINKPTTRPKRSSSGGGGMDANMMMQMQQQNQQQMQQMMQQMQQQAQQAQGGGAGGAKAKPGEVRLLANERENSILATAPPDKMVIVAQAVKMLDVQPSRGDNLFQNVQRMQVYRLNGVDPQTLTDLLEEVGNLEPTTKVQVDAKNKSIVAYASLVDHMTIKLLVDKLDGSSRKFQVIPLRKLEADYVAGSIEFMMGGAEKEKTQTRSNPYYYDYYNPYGGNRSTTTDSTDKFKVDADVENNRLLLWANEIELREIENLLIKLGELPPPGGNRNTQRYLENLDPEDTDLLLEKVRRMWPGISPNELIIDDAPARKPKRVEPTDAPATEPPPAAAPSTSPQEPAKSKSSKKLNAPKAQAPQLKARQVWLAVAEESVDDKSVDEESNQPGETPSRPPVADGSNLQRPAATDESPADRPVTVPPRSGERGNAETTDDKKSAERTPAPIRIRRGPDGKLVLESQDTTALDQLEDLIKEATPPKRDFKVFYLKYPSTWAYSVELSLKDFFDEGKKKTDNFNPYYGFRMGGGDDKDAARRLSKRKPLKFISDSDSGTIIVQGATPEQLKVVEDLINIYDQPLASDGKQVRKTQVFTLKYSKATVLAEAVKDVYRDLLSATDKALQNNQPGKEGQQKPPERNYTFIYGGGGSEDKTKSQETPVKFKGLISVGVDDISNTIIVSAPESLLENISELIDQLDRAARATNSVQVVKLDAKVNSAELQKRLTKIFTKPQQRPQQKHPNQQQQQQQQQAAENGEEPLIVP
ncbi:MAG: secretin N-terminal domain-containing protein [Planctomycetaceae bacterium]